MFGLGEYTQAQIEGQMRIMGVSVNGASESGAPTTLIGQAPTDSGAKWISGGTTADGKPILTQVTFCKGDLSAGTVVCLEFVQA